MTTNKTHKTHINEWGLTPLQEEFCHAIAAGMTHAQAYATASPQTASSTESYRKSRAWELLQKPEVASRIKQLRAEVSEHLTITATRAIEEAARLATSDIGQFVAMREGKPTVLLPHELPEDIRRCVASFEIDEFGRIKYKLWDKNAALDKLFKHFGLYEKDNAQKPAEIVARVELVPLAPLAPAAPPADVVVDDEPEKLATPPDAKQLTPTWAERTHKRGKPQA
jgi:phage terminase small subunit